MTVGQRDLNSITLSEQDALGGLYEYSTRIIQIIDSGTRDVQGLRSYGDEAVQLMRSDARTRFRQVEAAAGKALLAADLAPSAIELVQVEVSEETRFSLLLAALLDVGRTGPLAARFWSGLMELVRKRATQEQFERVELALQAWTDSRIARAEVKPRWHASEWHNLDVFAHVSDGRSLECGLVIENKVRSGTGEQPDQLDRYWTRIGQEFRGGQEKTLFVFLTEGPRKMETAVESAGWWVHAYWADISRVLWKIAEGEDLSVGHRLLALQVRDLVRQYVLGLPTLGEDRRTLAHLRTRFADCGPKSAAWEESYAEILALWNSAIGGFKA